MNCAPTTFAVALRLIGGCRGAIHCALNAAPGLHLPIRLFLCVLAVLFVLPSPTTAQLLPVPPADTAGMEPAVREQIEADRRALTEAIASSPVGSPELAEAYGRCGQLHTLYKLNDTARACLENAARLAPGDVRWVYSLGALLQATGDFEGAAARLGRALELRPGDPAALIRLGEVRLQLGRPDEARQAFEAALPAPGTAAAAHFGLGRVALAQGDARAAAGHFEAVLKSQPGASEVRSPLGIAYRKLGRLDDARAALAGYGEGRVTFPDPILDQIALLNAGSRQYALAGTAALREKRFADAAAAYRKALEANPGDAAVWADLGVALEGLKDLAGAEQSYRTAVELEPTLARAHYNLGTLLAARGAGREGIEHLETAVRLDPASRGALFNLGQALAGAGETARALDAYDRLLKLAPGDAVARFHRAQALSALGRHAEAVTELGAVVAAEPGEAAPRIAQASALLAAGRDAEARARLEEGLALLPTSEALAQLLVRVLAASSQPQARDGRKALELAQKLLAAGPTPEREEALALALGETGRFAEAVDHQRRALAGTAAGSPARTRLERCLALYARDEPCRAPGG
jgi:tetratricopeptide (TPR) repeat protein